MCVCVCVCVCPKSLQACPVLCDPILEWVSFPPLRDLPDPGVEPASLKSPHCQAGSFPLAPPGKPLTRIWFLLSHSPRTTRRWESCGAQNLRDVQKCWLHLDPIPPVPERRQSRPHTFGGFLHNLILYLVLSKT